MSDQHNLNAGDSVVVKPGVKDPDTGANIGGWQGRISDISDGAEETTVGILGDSVTLKKTPRSMIARCEDEGLDWREMYLGVDDVKPAPAPRSACVAAEPTSSKTRRNAFVRTRGKRSLWPPMQRPRRSCAKLPKTSGPFRT